MGYFRDMSDVSLMFLKEIFKEQYLLPSRIMLRDGIDEKFHILLSLGISDVEVLLQRLKTKKRIAEFADESGIPLDYLMNLKREAAAMQVQDYRLNSLSILEDDELKSLESLKIKTASELFPYLKSPKQRGQLKDISGLDSNRILLIARIVDLCRIRFVSCRFAEALAASGFDTVRKIAEADAADLYSKVLKTNNERKIYGGKIGVRDMALCIQYAKDVPLSVSFEEGGSC